MNLKKIFVTAVAVLGLGTAAFAQGVDEKTVEYTQKALAHAWMTVDAHKDCNQLTDTDKAILAYMDTTIPTILNKIQESSSEVESEVEPAVTDLANKLITSQDVYPANMLNQDAAKVMALLLAVGYAEEKGLLLGRVSQVLQAEIQAMLMEAMEETEE